ncbi:MAG: hypothetical protein [Olavius algarvensis Gamma 1 endosymbiont]|nr:MAG: hypothetical protein [Olavius algarvensis Gamma 1 endosymbiont]
MKKRNIDIRRVYLNSYESCSSRTIGRKALRWARRDNDQRLDRRLSSTRLCPTYPCPVNRLFQQR